MIGFLIFVTVFGTGCDSVIDTLTFSKNANVKSDEKNSTQAPANNVMDILMDQFHVFLEEQKGIDPMTLGNHSYLNGTKSDEYGIMSCTEGIKVADPDDCHSYEQCQNGKYIKYSCGENIYDVWSETCLPPVISQCIRNIGG